MQRIGSSAKVWSCFSTLNFSKCSNDVLNDVRIRKLQAASFLKPQRHFRMNALQIWPDLKPISFEWFSWLTFWGETQTCFDEQSVFNSPCLMNRICLSQKTYHWFASDESCPVIWGKRIPNYTLCVIHTVRLNHCQSMTIKRAKLEKSFAKINCS